MFKRLNYGLHTICRIKQLVSIQKQYSSSKTPETVKLTFQVEGTTFKKTIEAPIGQRLWKAALDNFIPLYGDCEGKGVCGTCHIILEEKLAKLVPDIECKEGSLWPNVPGRTITSRAACQVRILKEFDGTVVTIPSMNINADVDRF